MKKLAVHCLIMAGIVILLPLIIVRGCDRERNTGIPGEPDKITVSVFFSDTDSVRDVFLEEYLAGVVAAEMPAEYPLEALKAQAVAARTYAYARMNGNYGGDMHKNAHVCTDHSHCQAWKSRDEALKQWGAINGADNWKKIEQAVAQTAGEIIVYQGDIANPVFHANSGGLTENAEEVWEGKPVPYLVSVASEGEEGYSQYKNSIIITPDEFRNLLEARYPGEIPDSGNLAENIKIIDYTKGRRVKTLQIGGLVIKGTEFREIMSLKSSRFTIEETGNNNIRITTYGSGHGVGMSQCGAASMASKGMSYEEILKHYYTGVELTTIRSYELKNQNN